MSPASFIDRIVRAVRGAVRRALEEYETNKQLPISIRRLQAAPGDTLVITTEHELRPELQRTIAEQIRSHFPGCRVLVLESGFNLAIVAGLDQVPPT